MGGCHQHSEQAAFQAIWEARKVISFSEMPVTPASLCIQIREIKEEEQDGMSLSLSLRVYSQAPFHHLLN